MRSVFAAWPGFVLFAVLFVSQVGDPLAAQRKLPFWFAIVGALALALWLHRRTGSLQSRAGARGFMIAWVCFYAVEYAILGPWSFVPMWHDGGLSAPLLNYLANVHDGGRFAHAIAGGQDPYAMAYGGAQYVSIERALFWALPVWLAILANKVMACAVGFTGAYRLCRAVDGGNRVVAIAVAAFFTVSSLYFFTATLTHGLGYVQLPLAVWLCVVRIDRPHYWPGVILAAIIAGASTSPTHGLLALVAALFLGAVVFGRLSDRRVWLSAGLVLLAVLGNWHEVIWGMYSVLPFTGSGTKLAATAALSPTAPGLELILPIFVAHLYRPAFALFIVAFLVLAWRRDPMLGRAVAVGILLLGGLIFLMMFPWPSVGLGFFSGVTKHYMLFSLTMLALPFATRAIAGANGSRALALALICTSAAFMLWHKGNFTRDLLFGDGGQSQYWTVDNLAKPDWAPAKPFRAISINGVPLIAGSMYRFDLYDGDVNLLEANQQKFWYGAIMREPIPRLGIDVKRLRPDGSYDIDRIMNTRMLALANVGYIFSRRPIHGRDLKLVSGPATPPLIDRHSPAGRVAYYKERAGQIFDFGLSYVYEIPNPLPRAFGARGIDIVENSATDQAFYLTIANNTAQRHAVMRRSDAAHLDGAGATLTVTSFAETPGGYEIGVEARSGGVLLVNTNPFPFWRATADGQQLRLAKANAIHVAVAVPPGAKTVRLRYSRPLLREIVADALFGGKP